MAVNKKKGITIEDVARAASVGKTTVSFVFNNKPGISEKTRLAVLHAAAELGFEPSPHARLLATGSFANMVSLFSSNFDMGVGALKIRSIQQSLIGHGLHVPIYLSPNSNKEDSVALLKAVRQQRPQAIICDTLHLSQVAFDELHRFQNEGGVLICYDHPVGIACDQVILNRRHSTYTAAAHLLQNGHREIGICSIGSPIDDLRVEGLKQACQEFNALVREEWMFSCQRGDELEEVGLQAARWFLQLIRKPSALYIDNDQVAQSFIFHLATAGIRVPRDLSIVGHGDETCARYGMVQLTTFSQPVQDITENVVALLQSRLNGYEGESRQVTLQGHLQVRRSVGPAPTNWAP